MGKLSYWNHNTAYYKWIKQQVSGCKRILDIGCGDGALIRFLEDSSKYLLGIDSSERCIAKAEEQNTLSSSQFICCHFEDYRTERHFDAIIFVASIHHMNMLSAIKRAKTLLAPKGRLVIIGLAKPSTVKDYIIEGLRILPCKIISKLKHMQSSEDKNIPVSYHLPLLSEVRSIISKELPQCTIRQGLYYRYLLVWNKP